jgi:hypothetical protein
VTLTDALHVVFVWGRTTSFCPALGSVLILSGGAEKLVMRVDEQNLQLLPWGAIFFTLEGCKQDSEERAGGRWTVW